MSWDASLHDDRGHCEGDWNYTHNCSRMIYAVLEDEGIELGERLMGFPERMLPCSWYDRLNGATGPDGAAYLDTIVRGLEADPERFRAMNPENGWGDYDSLLKTLTDMRDRVPEWPTEWSASG